jgi:hypothetical protein
LLDGERLVRSGASNQKPDCEKTEITNHAMS